MMLAFTLKMPERPSWDGHWSGEGKNFVRVRTIEPRSKRARTQAMKLVGEHSFHWPDGWRALVEVKVVTFEQARALRRESDGFSGYDWMIDSLLTFGEIRSTG
jgi:hypothetical protein